MTDTVLIITT